MLNPESYKDCAIEQISKLCESVTPGDADIIGDIIQNMLSQFKADLVDLISVDCVSGVRDRLEQTLSLVRSA